MTNLKQVFTATLAEMLSEKPLNKITVTDIVKKCNVSRQSFYYYFSDIYDIVEWIFIEETEKALEEYTDIDSWQIGCVRVLRWLKKNKNLVMNTYRSVRHEYVEYFIHRVLYQYIIKVVSDEAEGMNVTDEQCGFIANFYTLAVAALSLDWIRRDMKEEPEALAEKVGFLVEGNFKKALLKFENENNKH